MSRDWLAAFGAVYLGKILGGILIPAGIALCQRIRWWLDVRRFR